MKWEHGSMYGGGSEACVVDAQRKTLCSSHERFLLFWLCALH